MRLEGGCKIKRRDRTVWLRCKHVVARVGINGAAAIRVQCRQKGSRSLRDCWGPCYGMRSSGSGRCARLAGSRPHRCQRGQLLCLLQQEAPLRHGSTAPKPKAAAEACGLDTHSGIGSHQAPLMRQQLLLYWAGQPRACGSGWARRASWSRSRRSACRAPPP